MQSETPKETNTKLIKLGDIHNEINDEYKSAMAQANEAKSAGMSAVKAAIRTGALLNKAFLACGSGDWEKWRQDNCPAISATTDWRLRKLANLAHVKDLKDAKSIRQAYLAVGIIKEQEPKLKAIGTADVDIYAQLIKRFDRSFDPIIDVTADIDPQDMPHETREAIISKAQPMIDFVERVKAAEGV